MEPSTAPKKNGPPRTPKPRNARLFAAHMAGKQDPEFWEQFVTPDIVQGVREMLRGHPHEHNEEFVRKQCGLVAWSVKANQPAIREMFVAWHAMSEQS